jgi:hypothetical protein
LKLTTTVTVVSFRWSFAINLKHKALIVKHPFLLKRVFFYGVFQKGSWIYGKQASRKLLESKKELEVSRKGV